MKVKVLCVCQGGNVRSVCLAYLLKDHYGVDAIACGLIRNSPETITMLGGWADRIIVLQREFADSLPEEYRYKVSAYDVGPDVWGVYVHPELSKTLDNMIRSDPNWVVTV